MMENTTLTKLNLDGEHEKKTTQVIVPLQAFFSILIKSTGN